MLVKLVPLIAHTVSSFTTLFFFFFRLPTNNFDTHFHGFLVSSSICRYGSQASSCYFVLLITPPPISSSSELVSVVWRPPNYPSKLSTLALDIKSNCLGTYFKPLILTIPASSFSLCNYQRENLAMPHDLLTRWNSLLPPHPTTQQKIK